MLLSFYPSCAQVLLFYWKLWWHRRHIGRALLEVIKKAVASFLLLQQCKNGVCSHFCFSNYLTSSLDREGAPGDPPASRIGRVGGASLLHSRGSGGASKRPPGIKAAKGLLRGGNLTRVQGRYDRSE